MQQTLTRMPGLITAASERFEHVDVDGNASLEIEPIDVTLVHNWHFALDGVADQAMEVVDQTV